MDSQSILDNIIDQFYKYDRYSGKTIEELDQIYDSYELDLEQAKSNDEDVTDIEKNMCVLGNLINMWQLMMEKYGLVMIDNNED